jgi:hypothetical protein
MEPGSFDFGKNRKCISFREPGPDKVGLPDKWFCADSFLTRHLRLFSYFFPVSHQILRQNPMTSRRMAIAPANGIISQCSDVTFGIRFRIAEGVSAIPMAASAKNNHLNFFRLSYFIGFPENVDSI